MFKKLSSRWLVLPVAVFFTLSVAAGQEQGPPQQGPPAGGGGAAGPGPGASPAPNIPGPTSPFPGTRDRTQQPQFPDPTRQQPFPEMQRPVFLSGKVMLDDGTPPPEPVTIERVCNGVHRPEGYTDSKGRFSIQLGQNSHVMMDASVSSADPLDGPLGSDRSRTSGIGLPRGISERDLMGCELRASLPGYRSDVVNLSGRRLMDNPDVGTIILRRLGNVEGLTISATSLQAPKDAKKAYEKGVENLRKQKVADAQKELEKAVQIYPRYAIAWHELGVVYMQQNKKDQARKAFSEALAADSKFVKPYLQMALLSAQDQNWQEVADTTDRVVRLNPFDFPQAFYFNSVANYNLQKFDEAEKSAREAVKLDTAHRLPKAQHILGVLLAMRDEYEGAAEQIRGYLKHAPNAGDADMVKKQLEEIEKRLGKTEAAQKQEQ